MSRPPLSVDDFEIGKLLGQGGFGNVYLVREKKSHFICAMKVLDKQQLIKTHSEEQILLEISILMKLKHPNVVRFYGYFYDKHRIYLITEYCPDGDLYGRLKQCERIPEKDAAIYTYQIVTALIYVHSMNVLHRDLKPENILFGKHGEVKLTDFGCSVLDPANRRKTYIGTIDYIPPEMLSRSTYTNTVDNWSLGVLIYEMLCGEPPFNASSEEETNKAIKTLHYSFPDHVSALARDLIQRLLKLKGEDRLPLTDVLKHPWLTQYMSKLSPTPTISSLSAGGDAEILSSASTSAPTSSTAVHSPSTTTSLTHSPHTQSQSVPLRTIPPSSVHSTHMQSFAAHSQPYPTSSSSGSMKT